MTRSSLFAVYNRARRAARQGRLDRGRLDRALGLAMRKDQTARYCTDVRACSCPDAAYRLRVSPCKHRIAVMLEVRALQLEGQR